MLRTLCLLAGVALTAAKEPNADTTAVCEYLYTRYPEYFAWDPTSSHGALTEANSTEYTEINTVYWNAANSLYKPACAFFPGDAEMVSHAVKVLNRYPSARFALKSGGHQPAPGFSATDGGVIISFEPNMAATVRSDDGKHFHVGPGARWGDVYNVTARTNQVVVGGRLEHIGVGGLTLSGGLSYYSAQYGLACDNVDNFEAVLANGTIVNANRTSNPDLWWALRGGGNQFAVVTKITTQAHPLGINGRIWGGTRTYSAEKRHSLFAAIAGFVSDNDDVKAAVIPTFQFALSAGIMTPIVFFFYDGPTPPAKVFADFDAIDSSSDLTGTMAYTEVTKMTGGGEPVPGYGASFREDTYPNVQDAGTMTEFYEMVWQKNYEKAKAIATEQAGLVIMGFDPQPMTTLIMQASKAQGGNAIGLDSNHGDHVFIENNFLWANASCNEACPDYSQQLSDDIKATHMERYGGTTPTRYASGDLAVTNYNPLLMNDAAPYQDVYSSYGSANLQRLQAIKDAYDPTGFLTSRQGGFKLPAMHKPASNGNSSTPTGPVSPPISTTAGSASAHSYSVMLAAGTIVAAVLAIAI